MCSIDAGGFEAEQRRRISSFTCQIQPVFEPFFSEALGEFVLTFWGSNMCRIFKQEVGATVGAATLRLRVLKAAPCHGGEAIPPGDDTGVDVELDCDNGCYKIYKND